VGLAVPRDPEGLSVPLQPVPVTGGEPVEMPLPFAGRALPSRVAA
jgi:hypothetical protein